MVFVSLLTGCSSLASPSAVSTPRGVLVWTDAPISGLSIESRSDIGDWRPTTPTPLQWPEGQAWWLEGADPTDCFRLRADDITSPAIEPSPVNLQLSLSPKHGSALNGEPLLLLFSASVPDGPPLEATFAIDGAAVELACLDSTALVAPCAGHSAPLALRPGELVRTARWLAEAESPAWQTIEVAIWVDGNHIDEAAVKALLVGRHLYWGDLHAHSGLSHDGCEDVLDDCAANTPMPGTTFFDAAATAGLDFAALTEHAELDMYLPPDQVAPEGAISIWQAQQDRIAAADDVVALLGYEWTQVRPGAPGGHKTVLLEEAESCPARRVASARQESLVISPSGAQYFSLNDQVASTGPALWAALEVASRLCQTGRALTFAHHSAWQPPEYVDWTDPDNAPDPDFEPVIEIHSEHASSECADLTADGCDWGISTNRNHYPIGAVQTALQQGYRLGFVGGTDSHDARPGSTDDGPSCTSRLLDKDRDGVEESYGCHEQDGALTGAYAATATLDRRRLFDALFDRETVVTSGPRLPVRVLLVDSDGALHLPGAVVPAGDATIVLAMHSEDLGGLELIEAAVIRPDNTALAWTDTVPDTLSVTLSDGAAYLRLRLWDPLDEREQRIWLSPWFTRDDDE